MINICKSMRLSTVDSAEPWWQFRMPMLRCVLEPLHWQQMESQLFHRMCIWAFFNVTNRCESENMPRKWGWMPSYQLNQLQSHSFNGRKKQSAMTFWPFNLYLSTIFSKVHLTFNISVFIPVRPDVSLPALPKVIGDLCVRFLLQLCLCHYPTAMTNGTVLPHDIHTSTHTLTHLPPTHNNVGVIYPLCAAGTSIKLATVSFL